MTGHLAVGAHDAPAETIGTPRRGGGRAGMDPLATLDALASGIVVVGGDWTIQFVNAAFVRLAGGDAEPWVGQSFWERFVAYADRREATLVRETMRDGQPRGFRLTADCEAAARVLDVSVTRHAGGLCLELRDVTAVARRERQYDRLLECIGEALVVVDADWRIVYWNDAAERATGVARSAVLGRQVWERFPRLRDTAIAHVARDAMARRVVRELCGWQFRAAGAGAGSGAYDMRALPVDGGGVLVIFSEVSERVRRERELAERSAESESLRELARQMAAEADSAELLRLLCEAALQQCHARHSIVARHEGGTGTFLAAAGDSRALAGSHFPLAGSLIERVVESGDSFSTPEYSSSSRFFGGVAHSLGIGPMLLTPLVAHGILLGVLGVGRAVGEPAFTSQDEARLRGLAGHAALALWKAQLLDEAEAASRAKSNFLATMSHELRTPLAALTGYGELLADHIVGPLTAEQADVIERMQAVTHQLSALIEEVLTFSSIEAGRESVRPTPALLAEVVQGVITVTQPLAKQKGLGLQLELPTEHVTLSTDIDKLRQVLVNLLGNAVKFTDEGHVRLAVACDGEEVSFAVEDTGIGIAPADRERLFQPFSQLDTGLTRRHGGSGLGLYISRRLTELLGGRLELDSRPGAGSTFTVTIPIRLTAAC